MTRIMHTALVFLFVVAALFGYGAKEETRALGKEIGALEARRAALRSDIALLRAEWDHVTSADFLIKTAERLDGPGPLRDGEGAALLPWRAAQVVALGPPAKRATAPKAGGAAPTPENDAKPGAALLASRAERGEEAISQGRLMVGSVPGGKVTAPGSAAAPTENAPTESGGSESVERESRP